MSLIRIIACGDIALCRGVEQMVLAGKGDQLARDLRQRVRKADLFLANLECPLTDWEQPQWNYFPTLKGGKTVGRVLKDLGVNVASLANNHIADYGKVGLRDTISVLEEQDIAWVGAGFSKEEAEKPLVIEKKGMRIGILALAQTEISAARNGGWGAGVLSDKFAVTSVKSLREEADLVIVYLHFGVEFFEYPTPHQVRLCRSLIEAGAKLVIGHHPHVPQGYERYKDGFIAYSLGNFLFDMADGPHMFSRLGLVVQADFHNKTLTDVKILPIETRCGNMRFLDANEESEADLYLSQLSEVLTDRKKLRETYYYACRNNFELYVGAFFHNAFCKINWQQARDIILQNFWPQLFELRKDLASFLFSGEALKIERFRKKTPTDLKGHLWRWVCFLGQSLGLLLRPVLRFKMM